MSLPEPEPGLVIRYSYLWQREHQLGREEGAKARPCAVLLVVREEFDQTRVIVLPVTHSNPGDPMLAVEILQGTKRRLGLDDDRSWIMLHEFNEFLWPGPDLRPAPGGDLSTVSYGFLPPGFFRVVRDRFIALVKTRQTDAVRRSE